VHSSPHGITRKRGDTIRDYGRSKICAIIRRRSINISATPQLNLSLPFFSSTMSRQKFSEQSTLRKSVSPIMIGLFLILCAWIAYKAYLAVQAGIKSAQESLKKRGVSLEGGHANVKVRAVDETSYLDKTQRAFVTAWNNSETRGYYSRLWSKQDLRDHPEKKH